MSEIYCPTPEDFEKAESVMTNDQKEMSNERKEKENRLSTIRKEIDYTGDRLGYPIDEGIKETVVFLKALGIPTTSSCEGHSDNGLPWPWVEIAAENEPEERWENQSSIFEAIGQKYNMSVEDVKSPDMDTLNIWQEAMITSSKNPETASYKEWTEKNKVLHDKIVRLVNDFYHEKDINLKTKIRVEDFRNHFRIYSADEEISTKIIRDELSKDEREKLNLEIPNKQTEMKEFTKFLEKKYWEG